METTNNYQITERIIDANLNRLREGIRVVEDISRYIFNNRNMTFRLKDLRHKIQILHSLKRIEYRDILNDVQKKSIKSELIRLNINDIITANILRAQESSRVLEEIFKLDNINFSELCKNIRYTLYSIEKDFLEIE